VPIAPETLWNRVGRTRRGITVNLLWLKLYNYWSRVGLAKGDLDETGKAHLQALRGLDPRAPARAQRYAVVDLETTGLDPYKDRVVSIGAFRVVDNVLQLGDMFHSLVNPGRQIPVESIKVHGLTPSMIEAARPLDEVMPHFLKWLGADIFVAHYALFDLYFLNRIMRAKFGFRLQNPVVDTVLICRAALIEPDPYGGRRGAKRCSLDTLAERYNIYVPERHTALGDAMTTALLLLCLLRELEKGGWSTLRDLVRIAGTW
jgi:DNA polymerase-3 subunit epsilon